MLARPGVERGRHVPSPHRMKEMSKEEMEKHAQESAECRCPFSFLKEFLYLSCTLGSIIALLRSSRALAFSLDLTDDWVSKSIKKKLC